MKVRVCKDKYLTSPAAPGEDKKDGDVFEVDDLSAKDWAAKGWVEVVSEVDAPIRPIR